MKMCLRYNPAVSSAVTSSWHGIKTAVLVQSWSTTVRMESLPMDSGSFVMKSRVMVLNGSASGLA